MCEREARGMRDLCHFTERVGLFETTTRFRRDSPDITFQEAFRLNMEGVTEKGWSKSAIGTLTWPHNAPPKNPTMVFTPSCASVHAMFLEVLHHLRKTIQELPRLISSPSLAVIMVQKKKMKSGRRPASSEKRGNKQQRKSLSSEGGGSGSGGGGHLTIEELLASSPNLSACRDDILHKITTDFDEAQEICNSFSYLRGIYDFEINFNAEEWLNCENIQLPAIQLLLHMSDSWTERLTKGTKNGQAVGVVHVETKTLQREVCCYCCRCGGGGGGAIVHFVFSLLFFFLFSLSDKNCVYPGLSCSYSHLSLSPTFLSLSLPLPLPIPSSTPLYH